LSIMKCSYSNTLMLNAASDLAVAPALLERPFLQRLLPADDAS
jgi:hypothetical protein